jgi:Kef-type K+ transport system membrane component KefB
MNLSAWPALLVGGLVVLCLLSKALLEAADLPDLLGYLLIGVGLRAADATGGVLPAPAPRLLAFLAEVGVVALLFRIGLSRNVQNLLRRLPGATVIWLGNALASLALGFGAARYGLGWALLPSLFVAVALMATGIGVSVRVWRSVYRLDSARGALMLDVAELDDLSGVVLLALLTALVPDWQAGGVPAASTVAATLGSVGAKLLLLTAGGVLFARYVEGPLTRWLHDAQPRPDLMITVLGIGLLVAGLAALLGFSAALGGFFAGLLFSRNPRAVKVGASFDSLYDLFVPFFFVYVGFSLDPTSLVGQGPAVGLLLAAAVVGKGLGSFVPALRSLAPTEAAVFAVSLIPRSEITLLVMQRGLDLGVVSPAVFGPVVAVVAATMVGVPLALQLLLR